MITITKQEYLDLLHFKLYSLQQAEEKDSTWNYDIEGTKERIKEVKQSILTGSTNEPQWLNEV